MSTLSLQIADLRKQGYDIDLCIKNESICNERSGEEFPIDSIKIDKHFRFEGNSNPSDNSILYAISIDDKFKGVLIDAYGVDSSVSKTLYKLIS